MCFFYYYFFILFYSGYITKEVCVRNKSSDQFQVTVSLIIVYNELTAAKPVIEYFICTVFTVEMWKVSFLYVNIARWQVSCLMQPLCHEHLSVAPFQTAVGTSVSLVSAKHLHKMLNIISKFIVNISCSVYYK